MIKNTVKFVLGIGIAALTVAGLSGCSVSVDGEDYRSVSPVFDIEQFFDGNVKAWGIVQNRSGEVVQRFVVDIDGSVDGDTLTLDESFNYGVGDGPTSIGFSPSLVFAIVAINLAYQFFVHTQTIGNLGWVERIFNTPTHHSIHHATNKPYIDKNYGGVLIIWDKLFGTFAKEDKTITIKYGIVGKMPEDNPLSANFSQIGVLREQLQHAKGIKAKLKRLFGYPVAD